MEDKARAIGFVSAGEGSQSQGVDEAKILVLGPQTAPERVLLLGRGQDYGARGVFPDATLCAMTTFKADAQALSSALTWVVPAQPVQSAQGFSYYVLSATSEALPAQILSDTAAFDEAMAAGRLMIFIVGGDETMTSMSVAHPKKVVPQP
jgi:hypothetical protein